MRTQHKDTKKILRDIVDGKKKYREIAKKYGLAKSGVSYIALKHGIRRMSRGRTLQAKKNQSHERNKRDKKNRQRK